jgi:hypothetical protein
VPAAGLAVTLAERRDFGMIQRIQRFTTQRIPSATIEGLEPQRRPFDGAPPRRPHDGPVGRPGHDAPFARPAHDATHARPFADRRDGPAPGPRGPRPFGDGPKARFGKPPDAPALSRA